MKQYRIYFAMSVAITCSVLMLDGVALASIDADMFKTKEITATGTQDLKVKNPDADNIQIKKPADFQILRGTAVRREVNTNPSTNVLHQVANIDIPNDESVLYHVHGVVITEPSGSGTSGTGESTWWAQYANLGEIDIIAVPDFIYSNATAAVPVKFQVVGAGEEVTIAQDIVVHFYIAGQEAFTKTCKFAKAHAKDANWSVTIPDLGLRMDGTGPEDNGTTDTYVAWVPCDSTTFRSAAAEALAEANGITTDLVTFQIEVAVEGVEGESIWKTSKLEDEESRPKIFGNSRVQIAEIGQPKLTFDILDNNMLQRKCHREPNSEWIHIDRHSRRDYEILPTKWPHNMSDASAWCKHCDPGHEYPNPLGVYDSISTAPDTTKMAWSSSGSQKEASVYTMMSAKRDGVLSWNRAQRQTHDLALGFYFGVSYGHHSVQVLESTKGMDIRQGEGDTQSVVLTALNDGVAELYVGDLGSTPTSMIDWATVGNNIYDVVEKGVSLADKRIGLAMFFVKRVYNILTAETGPGPATPDYDYGETYISAAIQIINRDGDPLPPERIFLEKHDGSDSALKSFPLNLNRNELTLKVGQMYVGTIRIGLVAWLQSISVDSTQGDSRQWDKITTYAKYHLTTGKFSDDVIIVWTGE